MSKAHKIINVKNITPDILESIKYTYPYGYDDSDLIKFVNAAGETVSALPIETEDAEYLVKINVEMTKKIDAYMEDDDDEQSAEAEDFETEAPENAEED